MTRKLKVALVGVTTAGTAEPLSATPIFAEWFRVVAHPSNTGNMYVGDADVSSALFAHRLDAGESADFSADSNAQAGAVQKHKFDLSKIFIDADTNGESVMLTYIVEA